MLVTIIEIVAFMVAAAFLGLVLGWVLRGALGNEQAEISELRSQLRKLKKAQREQQAASKTEGVSAPAVATVAVAPAKAEPVKQNKAVQADAEAAPTKPETKKPETSKVAAKPATAKKATAKKVASKKVASKKAGPRKTQAEREADLAAAKLAFADVAARIGNSERQDNLTKLYGVGKRYEMMLNDLGLSAYEQIAKLRKADVTILAGALGILDDRIETEAWVVNAKALAKAANK